MAHILAHSFFHLLKKDDGQLNYLNQILYILSYIFLIAFKFKLYNNLNK